MLATWSRRVALFSVTLILIALVLHRLGVIDTPLGIGLVLTGLAGAVVATLAGIAAVVVIWRKGVAGTWSAVAGIVLSLAIFAWPAAVVPFYLKMPHLNDVTTDTEHPPEFDTLAQERPKAANSVVYPGAAYATRQSQTFPQIQPMILTRSADEVFDAVGEAARRLRWRIAAEEPPAPMTTTVISKRSIERSSLASPTTSSSGSKATRGRHGSMCAPSHAMASPTSAAMRNA